jgi:hypothetical protein
VQGYLRGLEPRMKNRVWFDTEFIDDGHTIELLAIGMVNVAGDTYYAEPAECVRGRAGLWVQQNVLPLLTGPVKPRSVIAAEIVAFVGPNPEFWAYYGAYDWVALCQLFGTMMSLPDGWPKFCMDLKQMATSRGNPKLRSNAIGHNALHDALWAKEEWEYLR